MPQRIRLLATCQINGAVHHAGEIVTLPDGQRGPHRTVVASDHGASITAHRYTGQDDSDASYIQQNLVDVPLYSVIDEGIEKEREEMRVRHAEERNKLDHTDERTVLLKKQGEETTALELRAAETELHTRQEQEAKTLKDRQTAEGLAFDKRAETPLLANPPIEVTKEELTKRQAAETKALEKRQAEEKLALEMRKNPPKVTPPPSNQPAPPAGPPPPRMPARATFEAPSPVPIGAPSRP